MSDEDDLAYRLSSARKHKESRRNFESRPSPLITFAELFEQALLLQDHSSSQRQAKIYFDSNDEYVREE